MLIPLLQQIGLNENEAKVYLASLELGTIHAGRIIKQTGLARATVYDSLERLIKKGLISKYIKKGTTTFMPEDPEKLEDILKKQIKSLEKIGNELDKILPHLQKIKNPFMGLPSVKMYEGKEGLRSVLNDSLQATEIVYAYANVDDMNKFIKDINDEYVEQRKSLKIFKKALIFDTPYARNLFKTYDRSVTEARFLPKNTKPFHIETNIYDGKTSYMTYRGSNQIGVIIEDEDICEINRSTFELVWEKSEPV